jgi:hypothetical protein
MAILYFPYQLQALEVARQYDSPELNLGLSLIQPTRETRIVYDSSASVLFHRSNLSRPMAQELSIVLHYEKDSDQRYRIRSETLPWLHLEGPDIDAIHADLDEVVSDLLLHNMGFEVESLRWIPSPEDVKRHLQSPTEGTATYIARLRAAA